MIGFCLERKLSSEMLGKHGLVGDPELHGLFT